MTRASKTRNALFTSIISLLLCVSMLVGTTFAWFTDVAETGLNQIIAGNLDVELQDAEGNKVEGSTELFTMPLLWEPGAVAFAQIQVANVGNLDLQASMSINYEDVNYIKDEAGNTYRLSDVLEYAVINATGVDLTSREAVLEAAKTSENKGSLNLYDFKFTLAPEETSALQTLVIYWEPNDDEVDNHYNVNNGKETSDGNPLQINLGVKVFATQVGGEGHEEDTFGPDYDLNAGWNGPAEEESPPVVIPPANEDGTQPETPDVVLNTATVGTKTPVSATVDGDILNEGDKVTLTVKDSSAADSNIELTGAGLVYDVKVTDQDGNQLPATITLTVPESLDVTSVVHHKSTGGTETLAHTTGDPANGVKTLTFSMTSYSPVVVYHSNVAVIDGVYYDTLADALTAAQDGDTVKLLANVEGAVTLNSSIALNRNGFAMGNITVAAGETLTIDTLDGGVVVTADSGDKVTVKDGIVYEIVRQEGKSTYKQPILIKNADELFAFADEVKGGKNFLDEAVALANDINLRNAAWTPIGATGSTTFAGIFDGRGYTISNLNIDTTGLGEVDQAAAGLFGWIENHSSANPSAIKNLTIDGVTVKSGKYAGAVAGYLSGGVTVDNCDVKNAVISGTRVAAVVGFMNDGDTIKNCDVVNAEITGTKSCGEICGYNNGTVENSCTATNVTVNIAGQKAFEYAITNNVANINLAAGNYTMVNSGHDMTITGSKDAVLSLPINVGGSGNTITFDGITIAGYDQENTFHTTQLNGAAKAIYNDCTITGLISTYCNSYFTNCVFVNTFNDQYSVFDYGVAECIITDCTFNTACSKAVKLYNEGAKKATLSVTGCTFIASSTDKAAVEIDSTYTNGYTVSISNCEINEYYEKLWNDKGTKSVVVVDGLVQLENPTSAENVNAALSVADTVEITGGELTGNVNVPANKELTIESVKIDASTEGYVAVTAGQNATVTLNGGSYTAYEMAQVIDAQSAGTEVTVNDGTYKGDYLTFISEDAKLTMNGGTFGTAEKPGWVLVACTDDNNTATVTISGGTFYSEAICDNGVEVNITGGTFYLNRLTNTPVMTDYLKNYITISGGTFNIDPSAWVATGHTVVDNSDGTWTVK